MDDFTRNRLTKFIAGFKQAQGHDAGEADLTQAGFTAAQIGAAVRSGILTKYQVTTASGARHNRYKIARDWRSLRQPSSV